MLAFSNLADLIELEMQNCPPLPLDHLQKLTPMKFLKIMCPSNVLSPTDVEGPSIYQLRIDTLEIWKCCVSEKELRQLLSHVPYLSKLKISYCEKITRVGVVEHKQTGLQQQGTRGEEEIAAGGEGLLVLPPQLQTLKIYDCPELTLHSLNNCLRSLDIQKCPKFLSSSCFPFPASLQVLCLHDNEGIVTQEPLPNLTSLMNLVIWHILAHCCLTVLEIRKTPKFFSSSEPQNFPRSCKLEKVITDDLTGFLAAPICSLLSSSLTQLHLYGDNNDEMERFSKEQEDALQLLCSLQELTFVDFHKLQCLPTGLHRISSLKTLRIIDCRAFQSLPKDSLPNHLQDLDINCCPSLKSLPKDGLPCSLQHLEINDCRALKSLPKDGLPNSLQYLLIWGCPALRSITNLGLASSLRELDFRHDNSEELMRQCRKLQGTIPIIVD